MLKIIQTLFFFAFLRIYKHFREICLDLLNDILICSYILSKCFLTPSPAFPCLEMRISLCLFLEIVSIMMTHSGNIFLTWSWAVVMSLTWMSWLWRKIASRWRRLSWTAFVLAQTHLVEACKMRFNPYQFIRYKVNCSAIRPKLSL